MERLYNPLWFEPYILTKDYTMKSIQQSNLVYFDNELNQWVTNSYKMYQHFKMGKHRDIINIILRIIKFESVYSNTRTTLNWYQTSTLITDNGNNVDGYILTEIGFQKIFMGIYC